MRSVIALLMGLTWSLPATTNAQEAAGTWRFELGVAYATGMSDVVDHYEENLRRAGFDADVDLRIPVGLGAKATHMWASNLRADLGLGPLFLISGDVSHFELPVSVTLGYSFPTGARVSPFVRAGVVYHYVDGDQYSSTRPGALVAVGFDFEHFTIELASDQAKTEFDALTCVLPDECRLTHRKITTYDFIAGIYYRF